jgi:predicted glycoside hydrolase/deacetylase ChbG (UPF0249 family)
MRKVQIIINADDLGSSSQIDEAIVEEIENGRVTSTSIMANGPTVDKALVQLEKYPHCSLGVHLNLTCYAPLTNGNGIEQLLDEDGNFSNRIRERKLRIGKNLTKAIFEEWCAQIERIKSQSIPITNLDSHHHIHTQPSLFWVLKHVQKHFGIRKVRILTNLYDTQKPATTRIILHKWVRNTALRKFYKTVTTDRFANFRTFYSTFKSNPPPYNTVELAVHPNGENKGVYSDEIKLLRQNWQDGLPYETELISYKELR